MHGSDLGQHGMPSVAFWCQSECRNPLKPSAEDGSIFACTAGIRPAALQRMTASRCSKSMLDGSTELWASAMSLRGSK